jgi:ATP-dependent Clp protease adaptor protein ClpS
LPDKEDLRRGTDSDILEKQDEEIKEPEMWNVILHNDNYTTKAFVVEVLSVVFLLSAVEATKLMLFVHRNGKGVVGTYTYDIAQSKISRVHAMAKKREFPLKCSLDRA